MKTTGTKRYARREHLRHNHHNTANCPSLSLQRKANINMTMRLRISWSMVSIKQTSKLHTLRANGKQAHAVKKTNENLSNLKSRWLFLSPPLSDTLV
jgi:hypothetical protein